MECPHCRGDINPASLLAKEGVKKHGRTSEQMTKLAKDGWIKRKANKQNYGPGY